VCFTYIGISSHIGRSVSKHVQDINIKKKNIYIYIYIYIYINLEKVHFVGLYCISDVSPGDTRHVTRSKFFIYMVRAS